jgi:threonine dehydrogenase-like Zn-dependent dehydrogenase
MGHEFTGRITEVGKGVKTLKEGDLVVSPFTTSCGECFYCKHGFSSRCEKSLLFGCPKLDGGQAEYVRIPTAEGTVMKAPEGLEKEALVLMADIFPTGMFAAKNAFKELSKEEAQESTVVLLGLGPVGLCALVNALDYKPKHLLAVDSVDSRLQQAKGLGAEPWNFMTDREGLEKRVKELTEGRGADVVIEVVGLSPALKLGYDLLRPWGIISSVGVHNAEVSMFDKTSTRDRSWLTNTLRFLGQATKHTTRTCAFRWAAAPSARYSKKHLRNSSRSNICSASCLKRSCRSPTPWKDMISLTR